jgi:type VI secretion system protein ImpB
MSNSNAHKTRSTGQKFIGRNRAPRVQIEYDVETYGTEQKVEIPFVMGVVADLAGKSSKQLPDLEQRRFLDIDVDNFDDRLKSIQPRINVQVPNEIAGAGLLAVDLQFESMDDFSPASIARQVPALNQLLEARSQLSNLLAYIDGKSGAELLLGEALRNPALLSQLAALPAPAHDAQGSGAHASHRADGAQGTDPSADEPRA